VKKTANIIEVIFGVFDIERELTALSSSPCSSVLPHN